MMDVKIRARVTSVSSAHQAKQDGQHTDLEPSNFQFPNLARASQGVPLGVPALNFQLEFIPFFCLPLMLGIEALSSWCDRVHWSFEACFAAFFSRLFLSNCFGTTMRVVPLFANIQPNNTQVHGGALDAREVCKAGQLEKLEP